MSFLYILESEKSSRYYIGVTNDVQKRLAQHNAGMSKSTRAWRPWRLVHTERYETLGEARRREAQIKSWKNRNYMEQVLGLDRLEEP